MALPYETTRLSSKGQVVLPSSIRRSRQWEEGTEFAIQERPDGILLTPIKPNSVTATVDDVAGMLKPRRTGVSLEDMEAAIDQEIRERHARGRY